MKTSPKQILTEALQKISDEYGICFSSISIDWVDVGTYSADERKVSKINASCSVIQPCE